jgi:hypothetical protein
LTAWANSFACQSDFETSPSLNIKQTGGSIKISWPSFATGYVLEQNLNLATTNWSTNGLTIFEDGTNKSLSIIPTAGNSFFRLANTP